MCLKGHVKQNEEKYRLYEAEIAVIIYLCLSCVADDC